MKPLALQLYTLRAEAEKDFPGVLRRVAEIGYKGVETAGLYGHHPEEIGELIASLGMEVCSMHVGLPDPKSADKIIHEAEALGSKRIITSVGPDSFKTLEQCREVAGKFREAIGLLEGRDMAFTYHNHYWEFALVDGRYIYDILMDEVPGMTGELDVFWVAHAKADPIEVIKKYGKRLPVLHVKDGMPYDSKKMTAVGAGVLDIPAIINAADAEVLEWLIVELDEYDGDMTEAVESSYKYLTESGLAEGTK